MPITKNIQRTIVFRMKDAFGAGVSGTPTCKVSKDGATFNVCLNLPTSVSGVTGKWSIVLTSSEMNCDALAFNASLSGAIDFDLDIYPEADYSPTLATNIGTTNTRIDTTLSTIPASVWAYSSRTVFSVNSVTGSVGSVVSNVNLNLDQAIPNTNTVQTVGDCFNAARAQGFGSWVITGTTLTLYASDGTTPVRVFTLNSATAPTSRI